MQALKMILVFAVLGISTRISSAQEFSRYETKFHNGNILLFADIFVPEKPDSRGVGVALIQGSGASGRGNLWARSFAELLASNGYYALLPDKRGSGQSEGDWRSSSMQELGEDAARSADHLRQLHKLGKVGVMGLSQGGKIAPIVSQLTHIDFVVNIVCAPVTVEQSIIHEMVNTCIQEGLQPEEIAEVLDLHVKMKEYAKTRIWPPLEEKYHQVEKSSWAEFGKSLYYDPDYWIWDWIQLNLEFDPMEYWPKVNEDIFVAYGSEDQKDNVPVYRSIYLLQSEFAHVEKKNYVIHLYPTGHNLYQTGTRFFNPDFKADILSWLENR